MTFATTVIKKNMSTYYKIFRQGTYFVPKKFQRAVPKVDNYLVKPLGDAEEKKARAKKRRLADSAFRKENRLFLEMVEKMSGRKYLTRRKKRRNKTKDHDITESI
jgi:hypothetical protein